jgi:hypothetical protein
MKRTRGHTGGTRPRAVVVTLTDPIPAPLAIVYEFGFTEQVVACAGTVHETFTVEEKPKNGVTARSLIYWAVCPAVTVCDVIPRSATVKSAFKLSTTGAEFDAV